MPGAMMPPLDTVVKINQDFYWNISGNFSFATNRILERPTQWAENDYRYPIGQSTFAAGREEGYFTEGIIRTQEQLDAINAEWLETWGHVYTIEGRPAEVGSLFFQDIGRPGDPSLGEPETVFEPDGNIHEIHDKTYIERVNDSFVWKNLLPRNINLGFSWKNLKVSTLCDNGLRDFQSGSRQTGQNGGYVHGKFSGILV